MELLRIVFSRWAAIFRKRRLDEELDEELLTHIEFATAEYVHRGMSQEDARATAMRDFGGLTQTSERYRSQRGLPWLETGWQDLRFGLRQLRKTPGFAFAIILSLALGIGATVSVFSITYAVLVNPYPYADADRIVYPMVTNSSGRLEWPNLNVAQVRELAKSPVVEKISARFNRNLVLTGHYLPENVIATYQTRDSFSMLGVPPLLGRNLGPSDSPDGQGSQPVVMLNYKFWQRHFNGDPDAVGQTLELDHRKYTIVGVTGPRFGWGGNNGNIDVYLPQQLFGNLPADTTFFTYFKLRPKITVAAADAALQPLFEQFAKETPQSFPRSFTVILQRLKDGTIRNLGGTLHLLFAAVTLLLLIGCANASILLLARGVSRQPELAIRSAVGASTGRIVRQLLTESLLLSSAGTASGVLLAYGTLNVIVRWLPVGAFPNEAEFHIHLPVLAFSVALGLLAVILFGVFPSLQLVKPAINQMMQAGMRTAVGSMHGRRLHSILIVGQIALTLLLLTAASSAIESFVRLMRVPLGYDPQNVMTIHIPLQENTYTQWAERVHYFELLREKVTQLPDVISAGISTNATPPDSGWNQTFALLGRPVADEQKALVHFVSPEYFHTLHIPLLEGRIWSSAEMEHGAARVLVNETLARIYYPKGDAIGNSLNIPTLEGHPPSILAASGSEGWMQIIGIVADAVNDGLDRPVRPAIFVPYSTFMFMGTQILLRGRDNPQGFLHSVREQIASVNPDQQIVVHGDGLLETMVHDTPAWARSRLISILFLTFAMLALVLAAIGLYSVASYSVVQRTNEFGIRIALGAQPRDISNIVLASAGAKLGLGMGIGFALSAGFSRLIAHWVEHSSQNFLGIAAVSLLLVLVVAAACWLPAVRASSVDPITVLRCD